MSRMDILDRLRRIANRAGAPTMDYAPDYVIVEQRTSLDWIAKEAAQAIRDLTDAQSERSYALYYFDDEKQVWNRCRYADLDRAKKGLVEMFSGDAKKTQPDATGYSL